VVPVRRKIYVVDPDPIRFLIEDQNHEINNRDWKGSYLNCDRVACACQDLGDFDVPIDWIRSGRNEYSWWGYLTGQSRYWLPVHGVPHRSGRRLWHQANRSFVSRNPNPQSDTYEGGVRTDLDTLVSFQGSYRGVCNLERKQRGHKHTCENNSFWGISTDGRLKGSQGGDSSGRSTGASSGSVNKMKREWGSRLSQ